MHHMDKGDCTFAQTLINLLDSRSNYLPYVAVCSSSGVGKTKLLLELLYSQEMKNKTQDGDFSSFQKTFKKNHYVCFSRNGSIPSLKDLPSYIHVHDSNDSDPMIVGLRFLKFLLKSEFLVGCGIFTFGSLSNFFH